METPNRIDIKDKTHFRRIGYDYYRVYFDATRHIAVYEMSKDGKHKGYEVIKGKKHKNPDGTIVFVYPSDEDFGIYGWYVNFVDENIEMEKISEKVHKLKIDGDVQVKKV